VAGLLGSVSSTFLSDVGYKLQKAITILNSSSRILPGALHRYSSGLI
jgi:hypothetical protein